MISQATNNSSISSALKPRQSTYIFVLVLQPSQISQNIISAYHYFDIMTVIRYSQIQFTLSQSYHQCTEKARIVLDHRIGFHNILRSLVHCHCSWVLLCNSLYFIFIILYFCNFVILIYFRNSVFYKHYSEKGLIGSITLYSGVCGQRQLRMPTPQQKPRGAPESPEAQEELSLGQTTLARLVTLPHCSPEPTDVSPGDVEGEESPPWTAESWARFPPQQPHPGSSRQ